MACYDEARFLPGLALNRDPCIEQGPTMMPTGSIAIVCFSREAVMALSYSYRRKRSSMRSQRYSRRSESKNFDYCIYALMYKNMYARHATT